jgi:hypothetical protein
VPVPVGQLFRGAAMELALPGTWREPGDDGADSGHPPDDEPPVRAALGRLLGLVSRHRPHGSPGWSASAS